MTPADIKFVIIAFIKVGKNARKMALYDFSIKNDPERFLHELNEENDYYVAKHKKPEDMYDIINVAREMNRLYDEKKCKKSVIVPMPKNPAKSTTSSRK